MINLSQDFRTEMNKDCRKVRVKFETTDGTLIATNFKRIVYETGCNSNDTALEFGSAYSAKIDAEILISSTETAPQIDIFNYFIGFEKDDTSMVWQKLGMFKVDSIETTNNSIILTAFDKMYYEFENTTLTTTHSDNMYDVKEFLILNNISYYATIEDGVLFQQSNADSWNKSNFPSKRQFLSELAKISGGCSWVDWLNKVHIDKICGGSIITIQNDKILELSYTDKVKFDKIIINYAGGTDYPGEDTVTESPRTMILDCELINETTSIFAPALVANELYNIPAFNGGRIKFMGDISIEPKDKIVAIQNSKEYVFIPMRIRHIYDGGLMTEIESFAEQIADTETFEDKTSNQVSIINITDFNTNITNYGSDDNIKVTKYGNVCMLTGTVKNTASISDSSGSTYKIFNLPESVRPTATCRYVCQGSGINRFLLTIYTNGNVSVGRYGTTSYMAIPAGAWLTIACTYISSEGVLA